MAMVITTGDLCVYTTSLLAMQETYVSIVAQLEGHVALSNPDEGRMDHASDGQCNLHPHTMYV